MALVVLNIRREREDRFDDVCTSELFEATIAAYDDKTRYDAANLAAHNWDVIELDERIFIGGPSEGTFYSKDGKKTRATTEQMDLFYPVVPKEDYKTSAATVWTGKKSVKRRNEIQLAWHSIEGQRFNAVEEIMKKYRWDTRESNWKRVTGEYWDDERQVKNFQSRCKTFRATTTEIVNRLFS